MFWSLLRNATCRSFPTNSSFRLQSTRLSGLSNLRSNGVSRNVCHGSQRRMMCSRGFKELYVAKICIFQQEKSLKLFSRLLRGETWRFAGTHVGSSAFNARNRTTAIYVIALAITVMGFSYLAVPLYRLFCQVSYAIIDSPITLIFIPTPSPPPWFSERASKVIAEGAQEVFFLWGQKKFSLFLRWNHISTLIFVFRW